MVLSRSRKGPLADRAANPGASIPVAVPARFVLILFRTASIEASIGADMARPGLTAAPIPPSLFKLIRGIVREIDSPATAARNT
jgi:hypothetical protein